MKANSLTDEGALLMNSLQKEVFKIIEKQIAVMKNVLS